MAHYQIPGPMTPVAPSLTVLCAGCNVILSIPDDSVIQEISSKLRAGHFPTPSELLAIDNSLPELNATLERYEQEIPRLRAVLEMLDCQRSKLKAYVDNLNGLKAPIRQLPTELMTQIFRHRLDERESYKGFEVASLFLGQVCARWRDIALSSKDLWSFIGVELGPSESEDLRIPGLISIYLDRSGTVPLSVSVDDVVFHSSHNIRPDHPVLRLLAANSHRWREAYIRLWAEELTAENSALAAIEGNLPLLEKLQFDSVWDDERGALTTTDPGMEFFRVCPRLTDLFINYEFYTEKLPLHQLTNLEGEMCSVGNFMGLLKACPRVLSVNMNELTYCLEEDHPQFSSDVQSMRLSFNTDTNQRHWLAPIFDAWTLPRLRDLNIGYSPYIWPQSSFVSLLCRSSCPLETLSLDCMDITDIDLIEILKLVPTVTKLA